MLIIFRARSSARAHIRGSLNFFVGRFRRRVLLLVATETYIGAARDRLGIKPILYYENDGLLLLGSEQVSFEAVDPDIFAMEIAPGEVRVWAKN